MKRSPVWPAYLVAAVCIIIALASSIANISLAGQLRRAQLRSDQFARHANALAVELAGARAALSDLFDPSATRYSVTDGEIVTHSSRVYLVMERLPALPKGRVYQAWARAHKAHAFSPSLTFVPNAQGGAVVALPVDAKRTAEIQVTVEPQGGGRTPSGSPLFDQTIGD